jgi:long-chain acyl-CoA synthetase
VNNLAEGLKQHEATSTKVLYYQWSGEEWKTYTAGEIVDLAARWQQAFRERGFERGDRVAICTKNSVHWVAIDQACLGLGLVVVPLYVIDNPENIAWCIGHCEARLLILENARMLDTLRKASAALPPIVCLQAEPGAEVQTPRSFLPDQARDFAVLPMADDALASIVYTSGTTGRPKGVKLSHQNIISNAEAALKVVDLTEADLLLSVLPLSHMFERTCGYYAPLMHGTPVAFSRGVQQIGEDLATLKPTILMAVPRVFERFLVRIEQAVKDKPLKRKLFERAVAVGWRLFNGEADFMDRALSPVLRRLVAKPILDKLGGRLRLTVVGGAALEHRVARHFLGLGLIMLQGYGLSEASPVVAANYPHDNDPASVGYPLQGLEVKVSDQQELLVRGPSIMLGYWRNPEATAAVLSSDGWLNTGDQVDIREGRIYIKGRTKDILVLSNGEKVPTDEIEHALLEDRQFEQVVLVGEGRAYLILLAVTHETDEKKLTKLANECLKGFPRYIRIRRVLATKDPWTLEEGLLTPTLKVKRAKVLKRFENDIHRVYDESGLTE